MNIDLDQIAKTAIKAAYIAGQDILNIYNKSDFGVEFKADKSPITLADKVANLTIENLLSQTLIPIISEESQIPDYQIRKNWDYCWIVDPLDGTREFIKRNGQFTVNIALIYKGNPVMGVVYPPALRSMYFTLDNKAYLLENFDTNQSFDDFWSMLLINRIQIPENRKGQNYIVLASLSHQNSETKDYIKKLKAENQNVEIFNIGSSLKFCMIAAGKADIYPRFSNINEWDIAAGHALVIAAGGSVVDAISGKPIIYNKENLVNPWFITKI